jgi:hypothetical protein
MPNKLKLGTERVSYIEDAVTKKALYLLSTVKGVTISEVIREATEAYLNQQDPDGTLSKLSSDLAATQSDDRDERAASDVDPETLKAITGLMKKYKKALPGKTIGIHTHNNRQLAFANTIQAIIDGTFLVLPHPEVLTMYRYKGTDYGRWIAGMRRYQRTLK